MKNLNSKLFDVLNSVLYFIQNKTGESFLLSFIDYFIFLAIVATFVFSTFASTELIGVVSFFVPLLVFVKILTTKGEKIELEPWNFCLIIYLLICLISNFTSSMIPQSFYGYMKTLIYFAFYFAMCQFLKNNKKYILPVLLTIAVVISVESFIGLFQGYIGVESISTWQDTSYVNPEDVLSRVYGTLKPYNPNLFGGYLIAGISSLIALSLIYFSKKKFKSAVVAVLCFLLCALCIFETGCRGAYLALFVIILSIAAASYFVMNKKLWKSIVTGLCSLTVLFLVFNHGILKRLMSIFVLRGDSSTSFRMNVYTSAVEMFKDNWLQGIGAGNKVFREIYGLYMLSGFDALSCYCVFLEIAVESGIFALLSYVLFLVLILFAGVKKFIATNDFCLKALLFASAVSITAVMFHGLFDTVYFRPQIQYVFWTMAAVLNVLVREE